MSNFLKLIQKSVIGSPVGLFRTDLGKEYNTDSQISQLALYCFPGDIQPDIHDEVLGKRLNPVNIFL